MLAGNIDHGTGFDIQCLGVSFILDLCTGTEFSFRKYAEFAKQLDRFIGHKCRDRFHHGIDVRQASAFCFFYPLFRITVAIKYDPLMFCCIFFDQVMHGKLKIFCLFQTVAGIGECFRYDRVDHHVTFCYGISGTYHTEFKFISGKGKR